VTFTAEQVNGRRIAKVLINRPPSEEPVATGAK
jgi:hypothetical protein